MNASDTYFDLNDFEVQQVLALGLFEDFNATGAADSEVRV